jgi:hypothetical protein
MAKRVLTDVGTFSIPEDDREAIAFLNRMWDEAGGAQSGPSAVALVIERKEQAPAERLPEVVQNSFD